MSTTHDLSLGMMMLSVLALGGCSDPAAALDDEPVGVAHGFFTEDNAMIPNAIIPNAIIPNAIIPNAIIPNAITPSAIGPLGLVAIRDPGPAGDLSRMFLKYAVGCALDGTQTFSFRWTDLTGELHQEVYAGAIGLAPQWGWGALDVAGQRIVSACVAARTNFYGTPVALSIRGANGPLATSSAAELGANPYVEGAFWGNLFSPTPRLRACYIGAHAANSRAWKRDCANGHLDGLGGTQGCGMIEIVGDCADLCDPLDASGKFFGACNDPELGRTPVVVTTALPVAAATPSNLRIQNSAPTSFTVSACNTLPHTITITNTGGSVALSPLVSESLPPGLSFVSATAAAGACSASGSMVVCTLADLAPGAATTIVIQSRPTTWNRVVTANAVVAGSGQESDPSDNMASVYTQLLPPASAPWERMTAPTDATPIAKDADLWLNVEVKATGLSTTVPTSLWVVGGKFSFTAGGSSYSVPAPVSRVTFDPAATVAATTYDDKRNQWTTVVPTALTGSAFLTGVSFNVPANLPTGLGNLTWSGHLVANRAGVSATYRVGAAVYGALVENYKLLLVQPVDDAAWSPYLVADRAGSPEASLASIRAGGCNGAANFTGLCGTSAAGGPEVQVSCP